MIPETDEVTATGKDDDDEDDDDDEEEADAFEVNDDMVIMPQQQQKQHDDVTVDERDETETIEGVLFGRSVRSTFASLNLVVVHDPDDDNSTSTKTCNRHDKEEDMYHVLVRIQFDTHNPIMIKELRSYVRRHAKNGDLIRLRRGIFQASTPICTTSSSSESETTTTDYWTNESRYVVHISSLAHAKEIMTIQTLRYWTQRQWQAWHVKYYRQQQSQSQQSPQQSHRNLYQKKQQERQPKHKNSAAKSKQDKNNKGEPSSSCSLHHGGAGLEKRLQGEFLANFLLQMILHRQTQMASTGPRLDESSLLPLVPFGDPNSWATINPITSANNKNEQENDKDDARKQSSPPPSSSSLPTIADAFAYLNSGGGVCDAAGGSGHVSMALGLRGIQSTVVDPREAVGRLPGRDRKMYNRAIKQQQQQQRRQRPNNNSNNIHTKTHHDNQSTSTDTTTTTTTTTTPLHSSINIAMQCHPVGGGQIVVPRPFRAVRAWFGTPPPGVDTDFRLPDNATVPIIDNPNHDLIQSCRAIVALHPDEATDAIVDMAVQQRIPFCIVPCCVFCRLFPHRRKPINKKGNDNDSNDAEGNDNGAAADGAMVSTYQDLLDYLQAKDPNIQRATLPFVGANTVLFSAFDLRGQYLRE